MRIGIVGCGISGAYLGWRLAKAGHEVTIFERKKKVGGKACSGLISERLWDFIPKNGSLVENEIRFGDVMFPKKRIEIEFRPKMLVIDRERLDCYVAGLAKRAGARIKLGHCLVKIISVKGARPHIVVEAGGKRIVQEFDRIVGCDGANSAVREQLGAGKPLLRLGIYTRVRSRESPDRVEVRPTEDGFKWKIPRGKVMELGVIERPETARRVFNSFTRKIAKKKIFAALVPEGLLKSKNKYVALCGDAAGLTKPHSGGGVIWGMSAADIFVRSKCDVPSYNRMLERCFGPKIALSRAARKTVLSLGKKMPWLLPEKARIDSDWLY